MSIPAQLNEITGRWRGINRLYTTWIPENPVRETPSVAVVEPTARGRFLKIEYDWRFDDTIQEGLMLIGDEEETEIIRAFWIDSWHLSDKFLVSDGRMDGGGTILFKGFYSVPDHPDWGWNTIIVPENENSFKILMYNVSPEGEEMLAVEMEFTKPAAEEDPS
ncbi:MAG: DUF1579 family protein [Acidobacteria bacterium]|nr:DUF1579 family protein [Acidobacteriota bacterium]